MLVNVVQTEVKEDEQLTALRQEVARLRFVIGRAFPLLAHFERRAFHPSVECSASDYEELQVAGDLVAALEQKIREAEELLCAAEPDQAEVEHILNTQCKIRPPQLTILLRMLMYSKFRFSTPLRETDQILERIFVRLHKRMVKKDISLPMPRAIKPAF